MSQTFDVVFDHIQTLEMAPIPSPSLKVVSFIYCMKLKCWTQHVFQTIFEIKCQTLHMIFYREA